MGHPAMGASFFMPVGIKKVFELLRTSASCLVLRAASLADGSGGLLTAMEHGNGIQLGRVGFGGEGGLNAAGAAGGSGRPFQMFDITSAF